MVSWRRSSSYNQHKKKLWSPKLLLCWILWSTLVQVMACCLMAPSHYLNHCWTSHYWSWAIHLRAISQVMLKISIPDIWLHKLLIQDCSCIFQGPIISRLKFIHKIKQAESGKSCTYKCLCTTISYLFRVKTQHFSNFIDHVHICLIWLFLLRHLHLTSKVHHHHLQMSGNIDHLIYFY